MLDETDRPRWAWLCGSFASMLALALACSANEPSPGDDDEGGGGSATGGVAGVSGAATGGVAATGGGGGTVAPGGTGSGGVSGAATGGAAPTGGANTGGASGGAGGSAPTGGDGGSAPTGGTGGASGMLAGPIQRGAQYVLEFGDVFFAVNAAGARIVDVHLTGGMNLLTGSSVNAINYGSTFWTSPQAAWNPNWPPIPEVDSAAFAPTVAATSFSLLGPSATRIPVRVNKNFAPDFQKTAVVVDYSVQVTGAGQTIAPWEITRVFKRGLTFWPTGTAPRAGTQFPIAPTMDAAGCTWHQAPTAAGVNQKLFANGTGGWLAHTDGDIVIVKKFPDIQTSMAAPNEDEIEVFVSGTADYIEVEQQGAYQPVAMGASFTWTVTWFVRRLPSGVTATLGNQQLVSFVQSLVQ